MNQHTPLTGTLYFDDVKFALFDYNETRIYELLQAGYACDYANNPAGSPMKKANALKESSGRFSFLKVSG